MPYTYADYRHEVFTEDGQVLFLEIRDRAQALIKQSGAAQCGAIIQGSTGDTWKMLACVDRLVELGELREIEYGECAGQHRIFVAGRSSA